MQELMELVVAEVWRVGSPTSREPLKKILMKVKPLILTKTTCKNHIINQAPQMFWLSFFNNKQSPVDLTEISRLSKVF